MTLPQKIVAIHGAGMTAAVWDGLPSHLMGYSLRALTLPGHGGGDAPLPTIEDMAAFVRQKIAGEPCILLGHSMGALTALLAAQDAAVKGVILCGAAAAMPVNPDLLTTAFEKPDEAMQMILKWGVFSGNHAADDIRAQLAALMFAPALGPDLKACNDFTDGAAAASKLGKPTLVITGAQDKMSRAAEGAALAALIPGASVVMIPDCGHMIMAEKPVEISFQIRSFLER